MDRRGRGTTKRVQKGFTPSSVRSEVKKALSDALERKHFDLPLSQSLVVAGTLTQLNTIGQGSTASDRIGSTINYKSLVARLALLNTNATDTTYARYDARLIVFLWKPNSTPTIGNLLQDTASTMRQLYSPLNHEYRPNFTILYDSGVIQNNPIFITGAQPPAGISIETVLPTIIKPLTQFKAVYDGASSTDSNNRLYIYYQGGQASLETLVGSVRVNYTDA